MSLSSIELWQRVAAEGLASPMQCRSWAAEVSKQLAASETADGLKVLQTLIDLGKLTKYQAKILAGQSSEPLRRGPWHILSKVKQPQWSGWTEVTKIDTSKGEQPAPWWARWLATDDLQLLREAAPSLPRGIQLAGIQSEHLQPLEMPELVDGVLQLRVQPVIGKSLVEQFRGSLPASELALQIVEQTAGALSAMHRQQVVHGRVVPDWIFYSESTGVTLVRDPISVWTAGVDANVSGVLGEQLFDLKLSSFLAPEFLAPRQPPSFASDIYALGATWWWLLTGRPPAVGKNTAATLAMAAQQPLDFDQIADVLPEPLQLCLRHCLAKNPAARFSDATQLCNALTAAQRSIARGKVLPDTHSVAPAKQLSSSAVVKATIVDAPAIESEASTAAAIETPAVADKPALPVEKQKVVQPERAALIAELAADSATPTAVNSKPRSAARAPASPIKPGTPKEPAAAKSPASKSTVAAQPSEKPGQTTPSVSPEAQPIHTADAKPTVAPNGRQAPSALSAAKPNQSATSESTLAADATASALDSAAATIAQASDEAANQPASAEIAAAVAETATASSLAPVLATANPTTISQKKPIAGLSKPAAAPSLVKRRTKRKSKLPIFIMGGFGFLALLLVALKFSGALDSRSQTELAERPNQFVPPTSTSEPRVIARDPMLEHFRLVDSQDLPWSPPHVPNPIPLDLLAPGAQFYIALRPAEMLQSGQWRSLISVLEQQFQFNLALEQLSAATKHPLDQLESVVIAYYQSPQPEQYPTRVIRIQLAKPVSLEQLKASWGECSEARVGEQQLWVDPNDQAFFCPTDPDATSFASFSTGPASLMKEVAELGGGDAPLTTQFKQLHARSSRNNQLLMFGSPRYLFTEGRGLINALPDRLRGHLAPLLGVDSRAVLLQLDLTERLYWELQLIGATDAESAQLSNNLSQFANGAAGQIENWFVSQTPHQYWRALAIRFPQMIRTWQEYARFGVEDGAAVANGYLPPDAANNLAIATWIACQESSTLAGSLTSTTEMTPTAKPMVPEEILNKTIRLSFDQEPIERALALVGEEANTDVPAQSQMRFVLDGGAFERAGITRNQQLREYDMTGRQVREAITEIAKRGNPVTTVKDTRELDQRLIWIVIDDPLNPGKKMVSLTTRDAATAANAALPVEFAPAN